MRILTIQNQYPGKNSRGASKLTWFVFLTLFGVAFYSAYKIVPFYYYFFEMQNQMEQVIKLASLETDQVIRKKLEYHIKANELPVKLEALKIARDSQTIKVSLDYSEIFYISFQGKDYDIHEFKFHAFASGPVK